MKMKKGDLVTISAKGRRLRKYYGPTGEYLYPTDEYTIGVVVNGDPPHYFVTVRWSHGIQDLHRREELKFAKHPKRASSKRKVKDGNL
jgi:hypothetical protein